MVSASADPKATAFISQRLAKALAHPLRVRILGELCKRVMSPSEFAKEFDEPLNAVARNFRVLEKFGCIEEVEQKTGGKRRGGTEHFFCATQRAMFDRASWARLPVSIKNEVTGATFTHYIERVAQALNAGTLEARDDRHFTWTAAHFDQQAWEEMIERVNALFKRALELQVESANRIAESGEDGIPVTVAFACFESPKSSVPPD